MDRSRQRLCRGRATAALLAALALAGCQTTAGDAPPPEAELDLATVQLDWQITPHGPCVVTPPPVAFRPAPACDPVATVPGYVFLGVPYLGAVIGLGSAAAVSSASACQGEAASNAIHNRRVASLMAQQCMGPGDVSAMQAALARLGLLRAQASGVIDDPTFRAMQTWHAGYDTAGIEFGPTKEFAAQVIRSADPGLGLVR